MTFGEKVLDFYKSLDLPGNLPRAVKVMNPYKDPSVAHYAGLFFKKYFSDDRPRVFVFGINAGRFGAGLTGVGFTDPIALEEQCGIKNDLPEKWELSSKFIYRFIERWGGVKKFYSRFFLTAVSPLGFTRKDKNYNYYDDPALFKALKPFLVRTLKQQVALGARRDTAIVLGTGKNHKAFSGINDEYGFFKQVHTLDHPRFIMQYRRAAMADYLEQYEKVFLSSLP